MSLMHSFSHKLTGRCEFLRAVQSPRWQQIVQSVFLLVQPAKPREEGEAFVQADLEHVSQDSEVNFTTVGQGDNR